MEEPSNFLFCDDSYLCLLSDSSCEESADNGTLMSDEKFAEELQFQETLMASIITSNTSRRDSPPKESNEAGESSKPFCEICVERRENDQMFPIQNCGHSCCITCIIRHITANITKMCNVSRENSAMITCPVGLDCEGILGIDACREIVPKSLISMWDDAICESMLDASQKFYCPYKDCSSLMVNDSGDVIREVECLSCRRLLCVQCNVPWHSGVGCDEFKGMDPSERRREDLIVHQLAKEEKWQRSPTCKFLVEKTEECLHMTCRKKGSELIEEPSDFVFCDDSCICLLSDSSCEESADNGTLMSDEKFAEEVQFQETLMASIITSNTSQRDSPPEESKEAGESSKPFCEICVERIENDQIFPIQNCGHSCCITCIIRYITANITKMGNVSRENSAMITCPVGLDCKGILGIDACREIVPKYLISMWDDAICESMLDASQKFYCPYKDCSALMVNDSGDVIREAECLSCWRLLCVQCNVPWHSGVGCNEFNRMDPSERGREDLILHQLAKEEKWQRCPTCKFFVEKTEGCLHMTCRCGFQFCYACGGTWTLTHGDCR